MTVGDAAAAVQVAARTEVHPAAVDIRAAVRSTAVVDNLPSIGGPTGPDVFPVDTPRKRPTSHGESPESRFHPNCLLGRNRDQIKIL